MTQTRFAAVSYPLRLYSGEGALENLPRVLDRVGAKRAFIICGRSVSRKTDLIHRLRAIAGDGIVGLYDEMEKDAPLECVLAAVQAVRDANADLLIAVGAGTVIKAVRVIAILHAENKAPEELMTRYPPSGAAISPRLLARKLPIVNVLTAATTAQNRAGAAVKQLELGHRMEFFDPKTRPIAVFWDSDALLTAPPSLALNTGASVFWRALMNSGGLTGSNPLVEGERYQALRLAQRAIRRITDKTDATPRIEMCAAAFLQNREEDEGRGFSDTHWAARVTYALAASTINLCASVGQGEAYAVFTGAAVRVFGDRNPDAMIAIGRAMGMELQAGPTVSAQVADAIDAFFRQLGLNIRLRDYDVPREMLPRIVEFSMRNFNADRHRHFLNETETLKATTEGAW
jgi:alcohol dehydrogenase class IV